jgi:hypothetical protein
MGFNQHKGISLPSALLWLALIALISSVLLFLYFRDTRMLVSRSPDGQVRITLWDRADLFGDDLIVTGNRGRREEQLYRHKNDNCGPPRGGHVVWTPDSQSAAIFLCDGLCASTFALYDRKINRVDDVPQDAKLRPILLNQFKVKPEEIQKAEEGPSNWSCTHQGRWQ